MSKKNRAKRRTRLNAQKESPAVVASMPDTQNSALPTMAELLERARAYAGDNNWEKILELARTDGEQVADADKDKVSFRLLRLKVLALSAYRAVADYSVSRSLQEEHAAGFEELAARAPKFHGLPEFSCYVDYVNDRTSWLGAEDWERAYARLLPACVESLDIHRVIALRAAAKTILLAKRNAENSKAGLLDPNLIQQTVGAIYAAARESANSTAMARALVGVFQAEMLLLGAPPDAQPRLHPVLAQLENPTPQELTEVDRGVQARNPWPHVTPAGWAFVQDVGAAAPSELHAILVEYPKVFGSTPCDAVRVVADSLSASGAEIDAAILRATELLLAYETNTGPTSFGEEITLKTGEGVEEFSVGPTGLYCPVRVDDAILHLAQIAPDGYPRRHELAALRTVFEANAYYGEFEGAWENGVFALPGLSWLCENSLRFLFATARAVDNPIGQKCLYLEGLVRCVLDGSAPDTGIYFEADENVTKEEAQYILSRLEALAPLRPHMPEQVLESWMGKVLAIFQTIYDAPHEQPERVRALAQVFEADLLASGGAFYLGYIEHDYDRLLALSYYLKDIESADEPEQASVSNSQRLYQNNDNLGVAEEIVQLFQEAIASSRHVDVIKPLLAEALKRRDALQNQHQFERTAISRWPTLSPQARKVLSVLATVSNCKDFAQLGQYAGMDTGWAQKHYKKLVEQGMVIITGDNRYKINPHIRSLIEREAQHAVVGRIIQVQGSQAFKQVFNSQRELAIYQVMVQLCPNHLVFPNCALQSIMQYDRMKELVDSEDFGYYLRASVDIVVVSSTTYLPMLAIEVDSVWHDTEAQQVRDGRKDRLFSVAGIPFMRLQPAGSPSEATIRSEVAAHMQMLVQALHTDMPGYEQVRHLLDNLSRPGVAAA